MDSIRKSAITYITDELDGYNLSGNETMVLIFLGLTSSMTQQELSKAIGVDKALITRNVQSLEKQGYIARMRDTNDRRSYNVFLTQKGRELTEIIRPIHNKFNETIFSVFQGHDLALFLQQLEEMAKNAQNVDKNNDFLDRSFD